MLSVRAMSGDCLTPVQERPRVWIVDDDAGVQAALARLLRATALAVETFGSGPALLERLEQTRPHCLVLDLALPGLNGLDLFRLLHERGQPIPVVFVTGEGDVTSSVQAMKEGAVDYLQKPVDADALLSAVMRGLAQDAEWRQARERIQAASQLLATLTPREHEVLLHVATGKSNKRIAAELGTAEKTVKVHRGRVMHKLGAASIVDLVHLTERAAGFAG